MSVTTPFTGHCLCGAVSYEVSAEPMSVIICHCEECRRHSGAAFSVNVVVADEAMTLDASHLKSHQTVGTDTQLKRERKFCAECGSPVITVLEEMPGISVIKAGTLDDPSWVMPEIELYSSTAHPWVHAADAPERGLFPRGLPT